MNKKIGELRKKAMALPVTPGVYLMKDKKGKIIYIGKAKALKNRVSTYFGSQHNHTEKVRCMVENVDDFDCILTDSEFEALVLECSLIKRHAPKYNILLKDDKGYNYIKVTKGDWRRIYAVKQLEDDGAEYIGPYTSSFAVRQAVDEAVRIYRLSQCTKVFPRDFGRERPCLNYSISRCTAPCTGKIKQEDYAEAVEGAISFLKGGSAQTLRVLKEQMENAAEKLEFEKAARYRDRISAINKVGERQKVVSASVPEQDVFALALTQEKACLMVLRFTNGRLYDSEHFVFDKPDDLPQARYELITSYYTMRSRVPPRIAIDGEVADEQLLSEWLTGLAGRKVTIGVPQRGEQLQVLELCRTNAAEQLAQSLGRHGRETAALDEIARLLGLDKPPEYIESYDISHTAGSENVAGMVVFKDGAPLRSAYRRFTIKGFSGQDDCASMAEVISRRMNRYVEEQASGEGFGRLPDLILLDGGAAQVNAVQPILKAMQLDVPLFGMVKDGKHRTRAISTGGGEIAINSKRQAFTLISTIQEEVHRFAVEFHRKKRSAGIGSSLTCINGIGKSRAAAMLKHFKTIGAVKEASVEELAAVKGMTQAAAKAVYEKYHGSE